MNLLHMIPQDEKLLQSTCVKLPHKILVTKKRTKIPLLNKKENRVDNAIIQLCQTFMWYLRSNEDNKH